MRRGIHLISLSGDDVSEFVGQNDDKHVREEVVEDAEVQSCPGFVEESRNLVAEWS